MSSFPDQKRSFPGLSRGLSALLDENFSGGASYPKNAEGAVEIQSLPLHQIIPGTSQPRNTFDDEKLSSLMDSIREKGILQPLIIRRRAESENRYEIIAGERRWRAAKLLNMQDVPVIIRDCNDQEAMEIAIIENVQRDDLNPLEEAEAYQALAVRFQYTQEQIAQRIGKSRSYVANIMRLNTLPESIKALVVEKKISSSHARTLLNIENEELMKELLSQNLTVRDVENRVREIRGDKKPRKISLPEKSEDIMSLEKQISEMFGGAQAEIKLKDGVGSISLFFTSFDQLDDMVAQMRMSCQDA